MRLMNRFILMSAALSLPLIASSTAHASSVCDAVAGNVISNCGFETGDFTGWTDSGDTTFTAVEPAVTGNYFVNSGTYAAALGPGTLSTLSTTFADISGTMYTLNFYLYGDSGGTNSFSASVDGTTLIPSFQDSVDNYMLFSTTFTGTGGSGNTLQFSFDDPSGTNGFLFLDDVSVAGPASEGAAPEPSSLVLLGTGVLGFAGMARRKFLGA